MTNLDQEIQELEAKLREAKRLKDLEEAQVTINIHKLNTVTGKVYVTLSKFHANIVDRLRMDYARYYSGNDNIVTIDFLEENFIPWIESQIKEEYPFIVVWEKKSKELLEEWKNAPECSVEIQKSWCIVKFGRKYANRSTWLNNSLTTFIQDINSKNYKFAVAELYKFPNALKQFYPNIQIVYSPEVKKEMEAQLNVRNTIAELSNAKDTELENPFHTFNSKGEPYNLKGHQRVAVKYAEIADCKAIVAYDMGTGKTFIGCGLAERHPEWKRILIICPATLKTNWAREIKKTTGQDAIILSGTEPDALSIDLLVDNHHRYFIINFDIIGRRTPDKKDDRGEITEKGVMKWVELFNIIGIDLTLVDEAHYIKNMGSKRSQGVMALEHKHVIPMTGTPIVNRRSELYPLLHLVAPTVFNNQAQVEAMSTQKLHELILPYMIRRTRADVYGELHIEKIPFDKELSPKARELYNKILEGVYISLRRPDYIRNVTSILAQLIRMKQSCSSDNVETSVELAVDAYENTQKKVIITSYFKESHYAIQNLLGPTACVVNGDVNDDIKYQLMDKFQDQNSELKFWITNITEGLTLTEAYTVIHNDLWWTPKDHNQLNSRAFGRDNDPHGGNAYYVRNINTIDQFLVELITAKEEEFDEVIDGIKKSGEDQGSIIKQLLAHIKEGM